MNMLNWILTLSVAMFVGFNAVANEGEETMQVSSSAEDSSDVTSAGHKILSDESLAAELDDIQPGPNAGVPDPGASPSTTMSPNRKPSSVADEPMMDDPGVSEPAKKMVAKNSSPKEKATKKVKADKKPDKKSDRKARMEKKGNVKAKRSVAAAPKVKPAKKGKTDKKGKSKKS